MVRKNLPTDFTRAIFDRTLRGELSEKELQGMVSGLNEPDKARLDAAFFTYFTLARADDIASVTARESKSLFDTLHGSESKETPFLSLFRQGIAHCRSLDHALKVLEDRPELTKPTTWVLTGHPVDYRKGWIVSLQVEIGKLQDQLLQKHSENTHEPGSPAYSRVTFEYREIKESLEAKIEELLDSDHERHGSIRLIDEYMR